MWAFKVVLETAIGLPVIALKTNNRFEKFKTDY